MTAVFLKHSSAHDSTPDRIGPCVPGLDGHVPPKINVLAVIPARGGSKGLPRKNVLPLGGKPLIAHSIEVAQHAMLVDRVVVSSDDPEILAIASSYGPGIPLRRPSELAQDASSIGDMLTHCVQSLADEGYHPDVLVLLFPTHPFRTPRLVDFLISKVLEGHSPVLTVRPIMVRSPFFFVDSDQGLSPLSDLVVAPKPDQPITYFRSYGLFSAMSQNFTTTPYLHIVDDPIALIDIDYPEDFFFAEEIMSQGLFDFGLGRPG